MASSDDILTVLQNATRALAQLQTTINGLKGSGAVVLPQGAISGSAGAPTGTYLTITAPDGNTYKIELFAVS